MLALMGDGHAKQQGGSGQDAVALASMYMPAGQNDGVDSSSDFRPSAISIETRQLFDRPSPNSTGPHTNDMSAAEKLNDLAARVRVLGEEVDLRRQLLFCMAGRSEFEKDTR